MKKRNALALLSLAGLLTLAAPALSANAAWQTTASGTIYTQKNAPGYVTGLKKIGEYWYYFNSSGIMQTGLQQIDKKMYYFSPKGIMQFGWIQAEDGKRYYANKNGVLVHGKWVGNYYLQDDCTLAVNQWIDGKWVGADGKYTGVKNNVGWVTDGGKTYYYDTSSNLVKGWLNVGGKTYYLHPVTGVLQKGWLTIGGNKYFAGPSKGVILKNSWVDGKYLQSNGVMATGLTKIGGKKYLFNSSGKKMTGWIKYNGSIYYFNSSGVMQRKKWIGDKYVKKGGKRASGFQTIKGSTYYFSPNTGSKQTGWITVNGQRYFMNKLGVLQKGRWLWSGKYYASSTGAVLKGLSAIGKHLYYFDTTTGAKLTNSMKTIGGDTYYFNGKGRAVRNKWKTIKSKKYYFQSTGTMAKNTWVGQYYVGPDGARTGQEKTVGWSTVNGIKYYFDSNGNMMTGWQTISGSNYYFDATGAMVTGIQTIGSKKYYFYSDGRMASNLTIIVGSKQYTINKNGVVTAEESLTVSDATLGGRIVNFALQYVGNPYVYGGTSLTNGADCSGFVQTVFANFSIKLLRVADDQMKGPSNSLIKQGYKEAVIVDMSSIQPGDLLFYGTSSPAYATHVAIYMGNGKIVHASNSQPYPAGGIKVSNYDYQTPIRAVRYWY
ncbi:MAG TPA: C40 family peptidase [Candidatus Choladousia intestinipullorum]|nr:C40 family peptidase [Candidatus Choladousia intestinipullorum]